MHEGKSIRVYTCIILHEIKEAVCVELWRRDADRVSVMQEALEASF